VKLIDVWPPEVAGQPEMGGYELAVSMRHLPRALPREPRQAEGARAGQARSSSLRPADGEPRVPDPGHRIMVQVQSSWFPLYDRNPQTFVPSIFWAKPEDYRKATQRVYHSPANASFVELPLSRRRR
jgi:predicted acyl esterase